MPSFRPASGPESPYFVSRLGPFGCHPRRGSAFAFLPSQPLIPLGPFSCHPRRGSAFGFRLYLLLLLLCRPRSGSAVALAPPQQPPQTPYTHSLQLRLAQSAPNLQYLLLDLRTLQPLANTFPDSPIPPGSLLKPFTALAWANAHPQPFPRLICHGHPDHCWKAHGPLTLPQAIAQSCNAYFLALASQITLADFTLLTPPPQATPQDLIGLTPNFTLPPRNLALAYAALLTAPSNPTQQQILEGMQASATRGTAALLGPQPGGVLAKTGTAPCIPTPASRCLASGDGLVLLAFPAAHPTLLLLVRKRATTGAQTALAARPLLLTLQALHAY